MVICAHFSLLCTCWAALSETPRLFYDLKSIFSKGTDPFNAFPVLVWLCKPGGELSGRCKFPPLWSLGVTAGVCRIKAAGFLYIPDWASQYRLGSMNTASLNTELHFHLTSHLKRPSAFTQKVWNCSMRCLKDNDRYRFDKVLLICLLVSVVPLSLEWYHFFLSCWFLTGTEI